MRTNQNLSSNKGLHHVVREVQWDDGEPIAWAVYDMQNACYVGRVWYSKKKSAQQAADIFNGE